MQRGMLFSRATVKVEIETYVMVAQLRQETRPKARHDVLLGIDPYRKCAFSARRNDLINGIKRNGFHCILDAVRYFNFIIVQNTVADRKIDKGSRVDPSKVLTIDDTAHSD